jgi:O-antigen/teichoic acid export membrane protein
MQSEGTIRKIGFVAFSNIIKLITSVLVGFVVPSILGLTNYGYYKIFGLYLTYIGLFHFGLIDGIYLKFGGVDYDKLDKQKFRAYFKFLVYLELVISIIGVLVTIFFIQGEKQIIFLLLFLNLIAINLTSYYQFISQITSRFKEYSTRLIILSIMSILIVTLMYLLDISDYRVYVSLIVSVNYLLLFWYMYTYRDITFGRKWKLRNVYGEITFFFITGIPLLLANLTSTLVITVDKQIVEILFPVEEFGVYSFAYSMLAMINVVVSAVGVVLYPTLKKTSQDTIPKNYLNLNRLIILVVLVGLIGYFPLLWIIPKFLPDYIDSIRVFRVALPGLVLTSSIIAVKHNFFKITSNNLSFFTLGVIAIMSNIVFNLIAYYIYKSTLSIATSSVIGIIFWYITTEIYMFRKYKIAWKANALLACLGISAFYAITIIENILYSSALYTLFIMLMITINYKNVIHIFK